MQTYKFTILVTIPQVFKPVHREEMTCTPDAVAQRVKKLRASFGKGYKVAVVEWQGQR